jgi:NAD(P)-dependent dehydrogenase (short-subunit alcohol dehydrogenase family)
MCDACGDFNYGKRTQTADLRGRVALISGARVKIGYQAAMFLLRAGARVIVTTRFPRDAAVRYAREADFETFSGRLHIYGLDLRHTPSVEEFARHLDRTETRLDFMLHNACQTVRRPSGFYHHLMEGELGPVGTLPEASRPLVREYESILAAGAHPRLEEGGRRTADKAVAVGLHAASALSQVALTEEDLATGQQLFPRGKLDADLQQVDLRNVNSWRLPLHQVGTVELLEVQLVNAIAPFVLNARLKPLMLRHRSGDKHIVNVSAMEGQFYRRFKTDKHPHTNMAKAALNMMTRTAAPDYAADGIHMNSVDTGWVTDEDPVLVARRKTEENGFHPPLDIVDGAARIVDPIFDGLNTGRHVWGQFLKDYRPTAW